MAFAASGNGLQRPLGRTRGVVSVASWDIVRKRRRGGGGGLVFMSSQKSRVEILTPSVTVLEGRATGGDSVTRVGC